MFIPTHIKKQIDGISKDEAEEQWKTIKTTLDDVYKQKASVINQRKLYE